MNVLVDTHVLLWALGDPDALTDAARSALREPTNVVYASSVSAWEIELKRALGKLRAPADLVTGLRALRFQELPLRVTHTAALRALPPIHRDPFDRALVAQAITEKLVLVTRDAVLARYPVRTLRA